MRPTTILFIVAVACSHAAPEELSEGYPPGVEHERVTTSFYVWNDTTWKRVRVHGQ